MSNHASTSKNVVLPGFKETFEDVIRRYPVETSVQPPFSSMTLSSRETSVQSPRQSPRQTQYPLSLAGPSRSPNLSTRTPYAPGTKPQGHLSSPSVSSPERGFNRAPDVSEPARVRKKHVCSICDKDFLRPSSLETHMNSHTGRKPHKCTFEGCEKSFSAKSNMKRHLRKHLSPEDGDDDDHTGDESAELPS